MKKISLQEAAKHQAPGIYLKTHHRLSNKTMPMFERVLVVPVTVMVGNNALINKTPSFVVQVNPRCYKKLWYQETT